VGERTYVTYDCTYVTYDDTYDTYNLNLFLWYTFSHEKAVFYECPGDVRRYGRDGRRISRELYSLV